MHSSCLHKGFLLLRFCVEPGIESECFFQRGEDDFCCGDLKLNGTLEGPVRELHVLAFKIHPLSVFSSATRSEAREEAFMWSVCMLFLCNSFMELWTWHICDTSSYRCWERRVDRHQLSLLTRYVCAQAVGRFIRSICLNLAKNMGLTSRV